jgi:small subunit ribosomal protein S16
MKLNFMLTIRLQRIGKNKRPSYRVIISENGRDPHARSLEILGSYNPLGAKQFSVDEKRTQYWISMGAQMSDTVHNLFLKNGIVKGKKKMSVSLTKKRRTQIATAKAAAETASTPEAST